jgi:hypothetical protein
MRNPFRYFNSSPEVIRLTVMMYVRYPLSLRQVEDLLFERGIDFCHETVRFWWNRSVRCSPRRSASGAFTIDRTRACVGTWTRCSFGSMARRTISGGLLITREHGCEYYDPAHGLTP